LADKLKTTASLIDRARQVTNCADSQEMGWYWCQAWNCTKRISWVTSSGRKCFKTCSQRATKLLQLWWQGKALSVHTSAKSSSWLLEYIFVTGFFSQYPLEKLIYS
jgi:hypothetical protein